MKTFKLTKKQYPEIWPFTTDTIKIENPKRTKELYIISGSKKYNLNGMARNGNQLEEIWLDNPVNPGSKKSIGFIFSICQSKGF